MFVAVKGVYVCMYVCVKKRYLLGRFQGQGVEVCLGGCSLVPLECLLSLSLCMCGVDKKSD